MNKKIAIVGGGIGGLIAGYKLSQKGNKVTIFEKEKQLGGLMSDFKIENENLEKFYHHIFKTDKEIIELINELGLENKLKWHKSSVSLFYNNVFYPFNGSIDLLKFKNLDLISKLRLGLVYIWLKLDKNWHKYQNITAIEWMKKWAGKKAYKVIWEPLIKGKFHHYSNKISMAWLWARINTRGNSKGEPTDAKSLVGKEVLGYLDGGFGQIAQKLVENMSKMGGKIILNNEIDNKGIKKLEKDYDFIIDTRPIKGVEYIGALVLVFSSKQNLSKYYWHNINDLNSPFVAFIQHTNLVDKSRYNDKHIYYLGTYIPQDHKYFKINDKEIEKEFLDYLVKIKPEFDKTKISEIKIFKTFCAQHIVSRKYKVKKYKVSDKVYRMNFAQIYPQDRGINFAVKEAGKIVSSI